MNAAWFLMTLLSDIDFLNASDGCGCDGARFVPLCHHAVTSRSTAYTLRSGI